MFANAKCMKRKPNCFIKQIRSLLAAVKSLCDWYIVLLQNINPQPWKGHVDMSWLARFRCCASVNSAHIANYPFCMFFFACITNIQTVCFFFLQYAGLLLASYLNKSFDERDIIQPYGHILDGMVLGEEFTQKYSRSRLLAMYRPVKNCNHFVIICLVPWLGTWNLENLNGTLKLIYCP